MATLNTIVIKGMNQLIGTLLKECNVIILHRISACLFYHVHTNYYAGLITTMGYI